MTMQGVDVSHWQGTIDWIKVRKEAGLQFAMIKAGGADDGYYTDSRFELNYQTASSAGMYVGAYYFTGPEFCTKQQARTEAGHFLSIVKGKTFEMPLAVDVEVVPTSKGKQAITDAIIEFCECLENAGYYAIVYGSDIAGFAERMDVSRLVAYDKWVARYSGQLKTILYPGIRQYSGSGRVAGVPALVDLDTAYKDYPRIMREHGLNGYSIDPVHRDKTIEELAAEVWRGEWGNNPERRERLLAAGYDYVAVQSLVNRQALAGYKP